MCTCKNCTLHLQVAQNTARTVYARVKFLLDDPLLHHLLTLGISAIKRPCGTTEFAAVELDLSKSKFTATMIARAQESLELGLDDDMGCTDAVSLLQARLSSHPFWLLAHSDRLLLFFFAWAGSLALFEAKFLPRLLQN